MISYSYCGYAVENAQNVLLSCLPFSLLPRASRVRSIPRSPRPLTFGRKTCDQQTASYKVQNLKSLLWLCRADWVGRWARCGAWCPDELKQKIIFNHDLKKVPFSRTKIAVELIGLRFFFEFVICLLGFKYNSWVKANTYKHDFVEDMK